MNTPSPLTNGLSLNTLSTPPKLLPSFQKLIKKDLNHSNILKIFSNQIFQNDFLLQLQFDLLNKIILALQDLPTVADIFSSLNAPIVELPLGVSLSLKTEQFLVS